MAAAAMTRPFTALTGTPERPSGSVDRERMKAAAAEAAVAWVENEMVVGLGSGSTASIAVRLLAERVAQGLRIVAIPTSARVERQARSAGLTLSTLEMHDRVDLTIDGADEVELGTLNLIKGAGGALLREKIVAAASDRVIIVVDETKLVQRLGTRVPVPVEVVRFGWRQTARRLKELGATLTGPRAWQGRPTLTDSGHVILDCEFGALESPADLGMRLDRITGVVEHGLFLGLTSRVVVGDAGGHSVLRRRRHE